MSNQNGREPNAAPADDVGDLFDYDVPSLDEILSKAPAQTTTSFQKPSSGDNSGLGLDEEVKVTKTRAPVAKLDENRLLSQPGIPKLRRAAKSKLRFKGKGHEFSDAARLINFYQLWLDDLYPRAKFADGLAIIEKLGHSRRLQTMRRQWIDEEKPALPRDEPGAVQEDQGNREPHDTTGAINGDSGLARSQEPNEDRLSDLGRSIPRQEDQGDDGHNGLFIPDDGNNAQEKVDQDAPGDVPEHDELDDLLREQEESVFNTT